MGHCYKHEHCKNEHYELTLVIATNMNTVRMNTMNSHWSLV